jgi:Ca2+-binding EF-hand superfamily protein
MTTEAQGQILAAFNQFNSEPGKALEWESLVHVLKLLGPAYPDKEAKAALQASGKLLDGRISYQDFVEWLFGTGSDERCTSDENITRYLLDNSQLMNESPGLAYRRSANFEDRAGPAAVAPWYTEVSGVDCGNGFVDVGGLFLPMEVGGCTVLKETGKGFALGQCKTCTALGREPFFCHYRRVVEGCPVQVAQRFQSINEEKIWLEVGMRGVVLEVDSDGDRRVQFADFEEAQWVEAEHSLYLDVLPKKDVDQVIPEDIVQSFKRCDIRGDGLVHLGALKNILGQEVVEMLAEELDTIPDATGREGQENKGHAAVAYPKQTTKEVQSLPPDPSLFVQYEDLVAWMFDNDVSKSVHCKQGYKLEICINETAKCSVCSCVGVTHGSKSGYRLCYPCHQKALGKNPDFSGKWRKQDGTLEFIRGSKITLSGVGTFDLKLEDENKCVYTTSERQSHKGVLVDRGMKIKWSDDTIWSRSFHEEYIKQRSKIDTKAALKSLAIPSCGKCHDDTYVTWSADLEGESNSSWTCSNHANCGSTGAEGRNVWRWQCEKCGWDLCVHCGPAIPITVDALRPTHIPPWFEWLTAGPTALAKHAGKYYYEVRLGYGMSSPHVGFLTTDFVPKEFDGHGVGTEANGWAADGLRHLKWHAGSVPAKWLRTWQIGDVIGAAIDIKEGRVMFSLNGEWNEEATMVLHSLGRSFYPAVSMNGNWQMHIPKSSWRHAAPDMTFQAFADAGVFRRPMTNELRGGDRIRVQRSCMSNSSESIDLIKGELGIVRQIDEDGDALIDFDTRTKGEWVFLNRFENLSVSDTFRALAFDELISEDDLVLDEVAKSNWNNTLVGTWEFVGGTFEVEDRGGNALYFYDSELLPEGDESNWLTCTLPKTQITYRMQLNQPLGNVLVWQEMAKGSELWETTQYATRRGRFADGLPVMSTMQASIWSSVSSGIEIGVVPQGVVMYLSGPRQKGDGLWMAPLRPTGAVECRCIRAFEPLSPAIQAVDTTLPEGRFRKLSKKDREDEEPPPHALKYVSLDSLWQALTPQVDGPPPGAVLVKGSWLQELAESEEAMLPRRQDLPADAIWDPVELQNLVEAKRAEIVAVSWCWLSPNHPDPEGMQLAHIAEIIEQRLDCDTCPIDDIGFFLDWCSLHQEPRNTREAHSFQKGLQMTSLWFAHAQTFVWMLRSVPEGVTEYEARGWTTFEHTVSDMLTESCKLMDFGDYDEETCTSWFQTSQVCTEARRPPLVPEAFAADLATKVLTKEADRSIVENLYSQTFAEIMGACKVLKYKGSGWTMRQIATYANSLAHCTRANTLSLTMNTVGSNAGEEPLAAISLAENLPKCIKLRRCLMRACRIGDRDIAILAPAMSHCKNLTTLNLMDNLIGPDGAKALAIALPDFPHLRQLILAGNIIGEVGATLLSEYVPKSESLLELWLTGCGDLGNGELLLKEAWKKSGKAASDLHLNKHEVIEG